MCWETAEHFLTSSTSGFVQIRAGNNSNISEVFFYPTHIFKTSSETELHPLLQPVIGVSSFLLPSLSLWSSTLPSTIPSPSPPHIPPSLSYILHLLLSHRCSLEGWAASSIYFPLGCRWFCSLPATHILDHKRRSQSHRALVLLHCDYHSWEYQDLCRLLQANLKGKHTHKCDTHVRTAHVEPMYRDWMDARENTQTVHTQFHIIQLTAVELKLKLRQSYSTE